MISIKMADLTIGIHNRYPFVKDMCKDYLCRENPDSIDFEIQIHSRDIKKEQELAEVPCTPGYCESICVYREISRHLIRFDGFLLHGACIELDGKTCIFCAKSGTGKSTHLRLWNELFGSRAHIINGDKPIIRQKGNRYLVYGTPWCGKEGWNINTSAPLTSLCFLERGEINTIRPLPPYEIMPRLVHQIIMPTDRAETIQYLDFLDKMLRNIPCYLLTCNMEKEAAEVAFRGMFEEHSQTAKK